MNNPTIRSRAPLHGQNMGGGIAPAGNGGGIQQRGIQPVGGQTMGGAPAGGRIAPQQGMQRPGAGLHGYAAIRDQQAREAAESARRAQERQEGYMPPDFYLPSPDKRGVQPHELQANIVILDHEPGFAIHEHNFPDPKTGKMGKGSFKTICLAGEGPCPACEVDQKEAYYALKLSIIDMRPYINQRTNQLIPHTRKLLTVKQKNQPYFFRQFEQRGTLRGMQLLMVRDDPRGASHGTPEFIDLHPEELVMQTFAHPEVYTQGTPQNPPRLLKQANADCFPFDYDQLFPRLTYDELAQKVGLQPQGMGGYSSGYDTQQTWGADASQFNQLRTGQMGGGMASRGITPSIRTGQIGNQMVGDDHDYQNGQYDETLDDDVPFAHDGQDQGAYQGEDDIPEQTMTHSPPHSQMGNGMATGGPSIRQRTSTPQSQRPQRAGAQRPNDIPL